jgi:hypothetical protein
MIARQTHRRYANAMDWQLYRNDEQLGKVGTNEKNFSDAIGQVLEAMTMSKATHVSLVWTARGGFV